MKKSICPICNAESSYDAIYCSKCGTEINPGLHAYFCIRCGQTLNDNANYCVYCREPVPYTSCIKKKKHESADDKAELCIISFAIKNK